VRSAAPTRFQPTPIAGFLGFFGHRNSLVPNSELRRLLERHVQIRRLEKAVIPLHVIAAEVLSGPERRLSYGDAIAAILASAAIPAVLPPVCWGDEELIDGGITNNTPISHALEWTRSIRLRSVAEWRLLVTG